MRKHDDDPDLWILTFRAAPGHAAPMGVRVKRLLKMALRAFGLRCVRVSGSEPPVDHQQANDEQGRKTE
jgi:hypothetical protein